MRIVTVTSMCWVVIPGCATGVQPVPEDCGSSRGRHFAELMFGKWLQPKAVTAMAEKKGQQGQQRGNRASS